MYGNEISHCIHIKYLLFTWHVSLLHTFVFFRIGLPSDRSRIDYNEFLKAFEDGRKSSYGRQPRDIRIEEFHKLSPEEAEKKLKKRVENNFDDIMKVNFKLRG